MNIVGTPYSEVQRSCWTAFIVAVGSNAAAGDVVEFCGQHVEPVRLQLTLLDDPHEMKGYDLPAPDGEARFLVFDDALENNQPSAVAAATFAAVTATLRCAAQRH